MLFEDLQEAVNEIVGRIPGKACIKLLAPGGELDISADERVSAASLIKVPIMMAAYLKAEHQGLNLKQLVPIPKEQRVGGMGVVTHLNADLALPLEDIITLMIIVSDNTATNLCIDAVGIDYIRQVLAELGCKQTVLGRRLMDYEARSRGLDNWTSASDMVLLLHKIWEGTSLPASGQEKMRNNLVAQQFNTKLPRRIPYGAGTIVAHKTGEITAVEHDAAIIEVNGRQAYLAVLLHELTDTYAGQDAIAEIGRLVWEYLSDHE